MNLSLKGPLHILPVIWNSAQRPGRQILEGMRETTGSQHAPSHIPAKSPLMHEVVPTRPEAPAEEVGPDYKLRDAEAQELVAGICHSR